MHFLSNIITATLPPIWHEVTKMTTVSQIRTNGSKTGSKQVLMSGFQKKKRLILLKIIDKTGF